MLAVSPATGRAGSVPSGIDRQSEQEEEDHIVFVHVPPSQPYGSCTSPVYVIDPHGPKLELVRTWRF